MPSSLSDTRPEAEAVQIELIRRASPERQWSDVIGVLRTNAGTIDRPYLERHARALGASDLLTKALEEA